MTALRMQILPYLLPQLSTPHDSAEDANLALFVTRVSPLRRMTAYPYKPYNNAFSLSPFSLCTILLPLNRYAGLLILHLLVLTNKSKTHDVVLPHS